MITCLTLRKHLDITHICTLLNLHKEVITFIQALYQTCEVCNMELTPNYTYKNMHITHTIILKVTNVGCKAFGSDFFLLLTQEQIYR